MATTKNIQSVQRAFSILELFQRTNSAEYSLKEIAQALDLNKSTAFGLVNTLAELGYLQQNADNQKYALGLKLLSFSDAVRVQSIIIQAVHPHLERLSRQYGETVHCAVAYGDGVIYVDKVEGSGSIHINSRIGTVNDIHCTGVGKCILAYLPPEEQERMLRLPMPARTIHTITSAQQMRRELEKIRLRGYAMDDEEISLGLTCVAVPVFSAPGRVACAISISGMTARIHLAQSAGVLDTLRQVASAISLDTFGYDASGAK